MKPKKKKPVETDKRPPNPLVAGLWFTERELAELAKAGTQRARNRIYGAVYRRSWMKPSECAAWDAAKSDAARVEIEKAARANAVAESEAAAVARKASMEADFKRIAAQGKIFLTLRAAAAYAGVTYETISAWIRNDLLPCPGYTPGKRLSRINVKASDIDDLKAQLAPKRPRRS